MKKELDMQAKDSGQKLQEMAARIREMREIIGYTVAQMAEKTGVTEAEYQRRRKLIRPSIFFTSARLRSAWTSTSCWKGIPRTCRVMR